jgi:hypothetical protein
MMDTGLADRLRSFGLRVVEVDGWQSRSAGSFTPRGSVNHHTAGSANGSAPSLNTCIYGRPDLPGPLCHVMQSRESDGNDIAYVIAAGRANHAGEGGWQGLSGNSSVWGLEIEHTGTSSIPEGRRQIAATIHAAMLAGTADAGMCCQHYEWTDRKIDLATEVDPDGWRGRVADALQTGGIGPPEEDDPLAAFTTEDLIAAAASGCNRAHYEQGTRTDQRLVELAHEVMGLLTDALLDPEHPLSEALISYATSGTNRAHYTEGSRTDQRLNHVVTDLGGTPTAMARDD